jgi:hypothetical protein
VAEIDVAEMAQTETQVVIVAEIDVAEIDVAEIDVAEMAQTETQVVIVAEIDVAAIGQNLMAVNLLSVPD